MWERRVKFIRAPQQACLREVLGELDCPDGIVPSILGSCLTPFRVIGLVWPACFCGPAGDKDHAGEFEGQEWGRISKTLGFKGKLDIFFEKQINGKEKSAVFG